MNPMQLIQMIKNGSNPQQLALSMLEQNAGSNPVINNLLHLAKEGKTDEIEDIARNMFKEQGKDFDKEFNSFKQSLGFK